MSIRVLVVDDEELVRTGLTMILEVEPDLEVCGTAADGAQALARVAETDPDVVLMDVRMPVLDGIEATRTLAGGDGGPAVLVLTTYFVDEAVAAALRGGASGVVLKDAAPVELVAAIRAVARGEAWLDPAVARSLVEEFRSRPDPAQPASGSWPLSPGGSWRCCGGWPRGCPTPRSPPGSWSPSTPSRPT
ncbi:MAG: response regulator transcription factor [Nocardioides sp.]